MKLPITVVSITYNEIFHIENYILNILRYFDKVVIIDSGSTDGTLEVLKKYKKVEVVYNYFKDFGSQWNFAIKYVQKKGGWSLKMDPDERMTDKLYSEIVQFFDKNIDKKFTHCSFKRRLWYLSKPINVKYEIVRLWISEKCTFTNNLVNEHPIIDGNKFKFNNFIEHLDSKSHHSWIHKQNAYTSLEAISLARDLNIKYEGDLKVKFILFAKRIFIFLPFYRNIYFIYCYIFKKSILSGYLGYSWSLNRVNLLTNIKDKYKEITYQKNKDKFIEKLIFEINKK